MPRGNGKADHARLARLAAASVTREQLTAKGYVNLLKSTDLFPHGYSVSHWIRPAAPEGSEILEYMPRMSDLPRVTACCHEEQAEIHRALGINVAAPGERWEDLRGQMELFPFPAEEAHE